MRVLHQLKGGTGGGGWCHPQGAVHMAAARLGCIRAMVSIEWGHSHPGYTNELKKHYSHLVGGSFLAGEAALVTQAKFYPVQFLYCFNHFGGAW